MSRFRPFQREDAKWQEQLRKNWESRGGDSERCYKRQCPLPDCGKVFFAELPQTRWCSHRCANKANRKRREPNQGSCVVCGIAVVFSRNDGRYCSPSCRQKAYRRRQKRYG
jgi:hypothetical protein